MLTNFSYHVDGRFIPLGISYGIYTRHKSSGAEHWQLIAIEDGCNGFIRNPNPFIVYLLRVAVAGDGSHEPTVLILNFHVASPTVKLTTRVTAKINFQFRVHSSRPGNS